MPRAFGTASDRVKPQKDIVPLRRPPLDAAIFLDRDGVIIENRPSYVRRVSDVTFYPQALAAISRVRRSPYKVVVITNQAGVGKGLISPDVAEEVNSRIVGEIAAAGGRVDAVMVCPHRPEDGCDCRKPKPGLLLRAAVEHSLDLSRSILIGDALTDLMAGRAAGVHMLVLVRTGRGAEQAVLPEVSALDAFRIYDTLADALADLVPETAS